MKFVDTSDKMTPHEAELKYDNNNNDEGQSFSEKPDILEKESLDAMNRFNKSDRRWGENFTFHLFDDFDKIANHYDNSSSGRNLHYPDKDNGKFAEMPEYNQKQCNPTEIQYERNGYSAMKRNEGTKEKCNDFRKQRTLDEYFTVLDKPSRSEGKAKDNGLDKIVSLEKLMSQLFTARVLLVKLPETIPRMPIENSTQFLKIELKKETDQVVVPVSEPSPEVRIENAGTDNLGGMKVEKIIADKSKQIITNRIKELGPDPSKKFEAKKRKLVDKRCIVRRYCKKCEKLTVDDKNVSTRKKCEKCRNPMFYQCMICKVKIYSYYSDYMKHRIKCAINIKKLITIENSVTDDPGGMKVEKIIADESKALPVITSRIVQLEPGPSKNIGAKKRKLVDKRCIVRRYCKKCEKLTVDDKNVSTRKKCEKCRIPMFYQCMICFVKRYSYYSDYMKHRIKCAINIKKLMTIENVVTDDPSGMEMEKMITDQSESIPVLKNLIEDLMPVENAVTDDPGGTKMEKMRSDQSESIPVLKNLIEGPQPGPSKEIESEKTKQVDKRRIVQRFCNNCEKITIDDTNVIKPKKCVDCKIPMVYQCMICNVSRYTHHCDYRKHINKCAIKIKKLTKMMMQFCSNCNIVSRTQTVGNKNCEKCRKRLFFKCARCPNKYRSFEILLDHVNRNCFLTRYTNSNYSSSSVKSSISKIQCQKCGKMMKNRESLRQHYRFCGTRMISCEFCNFETKYPGSLRYHIKAIHASGASQDTKFKSTSSAVGTIKGTVLRKVEKTMIIECEKCKKIMKNRESLRFHMRCCGKKPISCEFCTFKTKYPCSMRRHRKRKHL